jgi:hypothetical protein
MNTVSAGGEILNKFPCKRRNKREHDIFPLKKRMIFKCVQSMSMKICEMFIPGNWGIKVISTHSHKIALFETIHIYCYTKTPGSRWYYESLVS